MIDLKKLNLPELKLIIKEYKNYISPTLTGLKKDDLIKLINKFNITLSNDDNKKIKKAIEKKEKKLNIPKVLTEAEKEAKERRLERKRIEYKQRLAQRVNDEVNKEVEELKKEGRYEYEKPKTQKEKVEFNFTSLYIPTKLKKSNYSNEQLNALYGDYEESFTNDNLNNIAQIMKENEKYKYVYDRFKEFVKYFKAVDIDKYINDLITYDFEYQEMPKSKRTRLPFFDNKIYKKTVNKTMSHDDYANYIKKAIEDIKANIKQNKVVKVKEPKVKVAKVKVAKEPKKRKPLELKLKPGIATKIKLSSIKPKLIAKYKKYMNRIRWEETGTYNDPKWEETGSYTDFKPTGTYHDPKWEATGTYHDKRKPIQLKVRPKIIKPKIKWEPIGTYHGKIKRMQLKVKTKIAKAKWEKIGTYHDPKWEPTGTYNDPKWEPTGTYHNKRKPIQLKVKTKIAKAKWKKTGTYHDPKWEPTGSYTDFKPTGTYHDPKWEATGTYHDNERKPDITIKNNEDFMNILNKAEQQQSKENRLNNPLIGDMYKLNMTYDIITNLRNGFHHTKKFKDFYPQRFNELKEFFNYCLENKIKVDMDKFVYEEINNDFKPKFFYPNFLINLMAMTNIRATINLVKHLIKGIDGRFESIMESKYNILEHPFYQGIQNLIQSLTPEQLNQIKTIKYHNFYPDPEHKFLIYNY